jgi:hypothetical protein
MTDAHGLQVGDVALALFSTDTWSLCAWSGVMATDLRKNVQSLLDIIVLNVKQQLLGVNYIKKTDESAVPLTST